jgi:hypothetical protein
MKILFRSCGGLGNQIFQLFYTRLLADKFSAETICHYHEPNYERVAYWEYPLIKPYNKPSFIDLFLMRLRLPKVLYRLGLIKREYIKFFGWLIVDGYFQNEIDYYIFSNESISTQINIVSNELKSFEKGNELKSSIVYHIRLGDFFTSEKDEVDFVNKIFEKLSKDSFVISNRDDLFNKNIGLMTKFANKNIKYVDTTGMSGLQVLNFLSEFGKIVSNGSSLSFASIIFFNQTIESFDNLETNPFLANSFKRLNCLNMYLKSNSELNVLI